MHITQREVDGVTIVDLAGRLVLEDGVTELTECLNGLFRQHRRRILLNFDGVTYLDSAGVGTIAWKFTTARQKGIDVKLLNLHRKSHNVLNTTRLLNVIESFDSEQDAVNSFSQRDEDEDVDPIFT